MALPRYTISGRKWRKEILKDQLMEIMKDIKHNPENNSNWIPMFTELLDYVFILEERLSELEERIGE